MQVGGVLRKVVTDKQVGSRGGSGGNELTFFKKWFQDVASASQQAGLLIGHGPQPAQVILLPLLLQVWQCGGRIEILPCSQVAQLERHHKPYAPDLSSALKLSALHVAEIWMPECKHTVHLAWNIPLQVRHGTEQKEGRTKEEEMVGMVEKGRDGAEVPSLP